MCPTCKLWFAEGLRGSRSYPAGIAEAGTVSLGGPASINKIDASDFSASRPAITHPAVPPLLHQFKFQSLFERLCAPADNIVIRLDVLLRVTHVCIQVIGYRFKKFKFQKSS